MSNDDSSTKKFLATQPPAHLPDGGGGGGGGGGDGEGYPSLLNLQVYVADRRNATTASCETEGGGGRRIQLTVCAARPPQVSYICVCCPGEEPDVFGAPPYIVATEADILLLAVVFGPYSARYKPENYEYYVYQAGEGPPSLQLIPSPGPSYVQMLSSPVTGILRYNLKTNSGRPSCAYIISAINYTCSIQKFELHVYHSRTNTWETRLVLRDHDPEQQPFRLPHKVITIGGEAGTMAWVDLWNGILFYDLFGTHDAAFGRYVPLPPTPLRPDQLDGCPLGERDIAVINGSIRYIELQTHVGSSKSARERRTYVSYGWTAFMWSRSAADPLLSKESWRWDYKLKASEVSVLGDSKLPNVESLPRLEDDEGEPRPTLARLHCGHPTLCLLDDHVFYLMNKIDFRDKKAWVLAVDTRNNTLRDVAEFTADRIGGFSFTYRHTRISEYIKMAPGTHHYLDQTDVHHGASQADRSIENADVPSISGTLLHSSVGRLRSKAWKEFEILEYDQNNRQPARAKCKHCKRELRCLTSQGTGILCHHLQSRACPYNPLSTDDATTNPATHATGLIYPVKEEEMMSPHASEELTETAGTWTSSGLLYPEDMNSTQLDQTDVTYGPRQADMWMENGYGPSISGTQLDLMDVHHGLSQVDMWIENAANTPGTWMTSDLFNPEQMNSSVTWMSPGLNNPQDMSIGHAPKKLISEYLNMALGTLLHSSVGRLRTNVWEEYDQNNPDRAHEVAHLREGYKVDDVVANQASINSIDPRLLALYKNQKDLIGIEGPRQDLTKRLSGGDGGVSKQQLKIVSICGIGGVGKTTLAKAVYDRLKAQFDSSAFVSVGRNPEVKKVFKDILLDLFLVTDTKLALPGLSKEENNLLKLYRNEGRGDLATLDEKQLIDKLRRLLENTRYLIVIDDVWDLKAWEMIECAMVNNNHGSRIIITTRILEVAVKTGHVYNLEPLSRDSSEELFYLRLFGGKEKCPYDQPTELVNKLLHKCGGVPLAIITIASLLVGKPLEVWPKVYASIGFGDGVNTTVENTRKILSFSYYDLPCYLRPCLLHLSIYPEDSLIMKDSLIWKWVAEDYVREEQGTGLFETGERYFSDLVNRNMIQPVEDTKDFVICGCRVHDMVFDMICLLSKEQNFVTILDNNGKYSSSESDTRRLAVHARVDEQQDPLANTSMLKLRSCYATMCNLSVIPSISRFQVLRVLALENCTLVTGCPYHLEHLRRLPQLRYLSLENTPIDELPEEIGYLKFLQTLDLRDTGIMKLPQSIGLLSELKSLRVDVRMRVPNWIGNLTSLEDLYLSISTTRDDESSIFQLSKLTELRVLICHFKGNLTQQSKKTFVESINNLRKNQVLRLPGLRWSKWNEDAWNSYEPPQQLRQLFLGGNFTRLPPWIHSSPPLNLSTLHVSVPELNRQEVVALGRLTELRALTSTVWIPAGMEFPDGAFPKLRTCSIEAPFRFLQGSMLALEFIVFRMLVRTSKDAYAGFDYIGSLGNLPSLRNVKAYIRCSGASAKDVDEVCTAVRQAIDAHPNCPTLSLERHEESAIGEAEAARAVDLAEEDEAESRPTVHAGTSSPLAESFEAESLPTVHAGVVLLDRV